MGQQGGYWSATRHPWPSVLFVLPLLAVYEIGICSVTGPQAAQLRNGADVWVRQFLANIGFSSNFGSPLLLTAFLLMWCAWRRRDRPSGGAALCVGMSIESGVFALGLYGLSQWVWPAVQNVGGFLSEGRAGTTAMFASAAADPQQWAALKVFGYLGAGIYEETLFRLVALSALAAVLLHADFPRRLAWLLAFLLSAFLFAGAHNVEASGEPFQTSVFVFRTLAGLYFGWLYTYRGFGIAVGAHAGYDVIVGILAQGP